MIFVANYELIPHCLTPHQNLYDLSVDVEYHLEINVLFDIVRCIKKKISFILCSGSCNIFYEHSKDFLSCVCEVSSK